MFHLSEIIPYIQGIKLQTPLKIPFHPPNNPHLPYLLTRCPQIINIQHIYSLLNQHIPHIIP